MQPITPNAAGLPLEPIRPTLFLALGGTGKEVLLRLRRRCYERFRTPCLPCARFLWLDTDTRDVGARGETLDDAFANVGFEAHEQVPLLTGNVGAHAGDLFVNRERWGYIHEWLYDEVQRYDLEISDGAGGVRAIGRLTFFWNYRDIVNKIRQSLGVLRQQETLRATVDFYRKHGLGEADIAQVPDPVVVLVSSLAGGTGCGTVLDTAFLLRRLMTAQRPGGHPEHRLDKLLAYLLMPNVYYAGAEGEELATRSFANAYAALKEIDFYAKRLPAPDQAADRELSVDYQVQWEPDERLQIQGPPFTVAYLVEMKNEANLTVSHANRRDVFSMLAESLFTDLLPGAFAATKRSDHSNIAQQLAGAAGANVRGGGILVPQSFSRRYASCGMSKIEIPVDAIRGACETRLAADIFRYILRNNDDLNAGREMVEDLAVRRLDREGLLSRFGPQWKETVRDQVRRLFAAADPHSAADLKQLEDGVRELELRLVRTDTHDPARIGEVVRHLRNSTAGVLEQSCDECRNLVHEACLEADTRGLKAAVRDGGYLHLAQAAARALYQPPEQGVPAAFDALRESAASDSRLWETAMRRAAGEMRAALPSLMVRTLGRRQWTVATLLERMRDAVEQMLLARAQMCLLDEAKKAAHGVEEFFAAQRPRLDRFRQEAEAVQGKLAERAESFLVETTHVLFTRLFDERHDWPRFYRLDRDETTGEVAEIVVAREYRRMLEQTLQPAAGLRHLVESWESNGMGDVERRVVAFAEERFVQDFAANPRQVSVLDHPKMIERRRELVSRLFNAARPMLRRGASMPGNGVEAPRFAYLGVADPAVEPYRGFAAEIRQMIATLPGYTLQVLPTGNPSEVCLYFSNYAFHLPSLPVVESDCHRAYQRFYASLNQASGARPADQIPLHLSKRWEGKFDDLVVHTDQGAVVLAAVHSVLLFGPILRVLQTAEKNGQAIFQYRRGMPFRDVRTLGTRRQAIALLREDEALRQVLAGVIARREASLTPERQIAYYWALQAMLCHPDVLPETPEHVLLSARLVSVMEAAQAAGADPAALDPEECAGAGRLEHIRGREDLGLEWDAAGYPALCALSRWERPAASSLAA